MNHTERVSLDQLNTCPGAQFTRWLGGVFEHSAWVAEQAAAHRPFHSVDALHETMVDLVRQAQPQVQLALIRSHPELAGKAAVRGELTGASTREQAGAGLDQCSPGEFEQLTELNRRYNEKFGFPFILAVRGYDRAGIIRQFVRRLANDTAAEREESLNQIYRIARYRLDDLIQE
jgi:2-oxo-4-hydroxy-4-carboxy-5-ureidoimidazoline decarboxylase